MLSDLRRAIHEDELELLEAGTGLRPATPDNTPRIGWTDIDGVVAAVGHPRWLIRRERGRTTIKTGGRCWVPRK